MFLYLLKRKKKAKLLKSQHLRSPLNPYYCTYTISSRLCAFK
uniref:Uncharacterized protein n=1 Tax=Siphoviridae sp. ctt1f11 TaxID=2827959 RepID=A0A8S5SD98_9CAUD|nr:MAG TPA: hypothetical protein [Siphoviridae sp. ctt1f11]